MGTRQRLLLGFGLVIGLFVLLVAGLAVWITRVDARFGSLAAFDQPRNLAAQEMESNVLGAGLATWRYFATGSLQARERIAKDIADFLRHKGDYDRLATGPRERQLSESVGKLFTEYKALSDRLVADRDAGRAARDEDVRRFGELRYAIEDLLDDEIQRGASSMLASASSDVARTVRTMLWSALALLAASAIVAVWTSAGIGRRIVEAEETLRVTIASIGDALVTTDNNGRVATMNAVAESLTGWSAADAKGLPLPEVFRIVNENTGEVVENPVDKVLASGQIVGLANHTLLIAKDGHRRPIDDSAAPIRAANGVICGVVLVFRDVTDRRAADRRLAESDARKAAILATALDCIVTIDHEGTVVDFNPAAERTFGYSREHAIGREMGELIIPPTLRAAHHRGMARYLKTGASSVMGKRLELTAMHADGREFPVELAITRITSEGPPMFTGYLRDISDRKEMEARLQQYVADLSEVDRRKNEFLATLAHELRNPLAPIRNAVDIVRLSGSDVSLTATTDMMQRQLDQLVRLTDDLLDISRINRGKVELRRTWIDATTALRDAAAIAGPMFAKAGIAFEAQLPNEPLFIHADPTRIAQVVGNLLNNAAKFTDAGGRVVLHAHREGDELIVRVADNGIGIASDQLGRIFDLFAQVDASLERTRSGLGIGLTLARDLAALHDGSLTVKSAGVGQGSEFVVRLPIGTRPDEAATSQSPQRLEPVAQRVLIVDDNRDAALSLSIVLKTFGHDVHVVHDGIAALEAAERTRPDAIVLDIGLPRLNGYEVCRQLRSADWGKQMFIVALTGWGADEHLTRAKEAGFDEHLVKPADAAVVEQMLRKRGAKTSRAA